jgi:transcriptional regulator with XRE-family HTH domain
MLGRFLNDEIRAQGISIREASRQIGVAHTTINRILAGDQPDLRTVKIVCKWLKIDAVDVLNMDNGGHNNVSTVVAAFLDRNPRLKEAMVDLIEKLKYGEIGNRDLDEILITLHSNWKEWREMK